MKTEQISKSVYYIGVNDRTTHKFEAMWPLPFGVSYNSYLVRGSEKSAVIDGVELSHALQLVDEIKAILGDCAPDYLVINHMEPDHSGAVRILRQAFPDIKIVGNALTIGMVKG
ncbi:MAG: MBL fold metallo-hydrolase, partial [Muribaculaceae bacterium]|nr:MBL fold metallo-hydrolase [Muribaculaceae bacterium]